MFQKARETAYLESTSIFVTVVKWRKPLLITVLAAAVASCIFSSTYFIKPKYKSTVIFFPTASTSISRAIMDDNISDKQDLLAFGEEEQAEQMLQILNSDDIRNIIIEKYELMKHYGINPQSEFPQTQLISEFEDNISFRQTEYLSIRIDVLDTDPKMAASIANDISALVDSMKTKIQRERASEALLIMEQEYNRKLAQINTMEDSLKWLRGKGIMDYSNQSIIWTEEYAKSFSSFSNETATLKVLEKYRTENDSSIVNTKARISGAEARTKMLQSKLDDLAQFGGANMSLGEQLIIERKDLNILKVQYDKLRVDVMQNLPHKFIVNKAVEAEKKSYPIRWLIVAISVFCSFIIALIAILIIERSKEISYRI
ncbi:hypothetical protein BH11BAC1_BH11BAC1_08940 [soil metagenome]